MSQKKTSQAATTRASPLRRTQLLLRRSMTRLDLQRAVAAVRSRTEDLKVERLRIASRWSLKLVPLGEVPTDRRRQGLLALRELALWKVATKVAGAHRARPRGRMRWANLLPHPNASHRPVQRGTRVRHDYDVNFNTTSKSWKEVNKLGLNWKIDWLCIKMFLHIVIKWSTM